MEEGLSYRRRGLVTGGGAYSKEEGLSYRRRGLLRGGLTPGGSRSLIRYSLSLNQFRAISASNFN